MGPMSDSIAALPQGDGIEPVDGSIPASRMVFPSGSEACRDPWSPWCARPLPGLLRAMAILGASSASALDYDDDELWRLGVFYVNREDSSVVVPRRFGIGWAMNWGNPKSWGLAALLVAAIAAFVVLVEVLFR